MRCSLNELERLCERAALAVGLPDGCDIDVAAQTAWLAGHGFPVVAGLVAELEHFDGASSLDLALAEQQGALDLSARPGCAMAGLLVDLLLARCVSGESAVSLQFTALRNPLYLLVASRFVPKEDFRLLAMLRPEEGGRELLFLSTAVGETRLWADRDTLVAAMDGQTDFQGEMKAAPGNSRPFQLPQGLPEFDERELARRNARILAEGVLLEDRHWRALKSLGQHRLVPPSDLSRSGAGAGLSDND